MQRELAHLREKHREVPSDDEKNQDQPWTIGTIGKYPVSNDFVPHLIHIKKIWEYQKGSPLTIRQALWCDKLKGFPLKDEKRLEDLTETQLIEWGTLLVRNAAWYAELERWGMIGNYQVDTSMYDDKSLSEIWNNITEYTDILRNNRRNGANNG